MNKQREELEEDYENLLRLIDTADGLKTIEQTFPSNYNGLFNDEDFLRGIFYEVDSSSGSLDSFLEHRKAVLPYVHYDIYEFKKSHLKDIEQKGWDDFLHSLGQDTGIEPLVNPNFIHDTDAFELILKKNEANEVLGIYNAEGYSDLLDIKDALKEDLIYHNTLIYAKACSLGLLAYDYTKLTKVEILRRIFSWLLGRPVEYRDQRIMYEFDSDLLGMPESTGRSVISHALQVEVDESKKKGAIIHLKYKLVEYILQERRHGRKPDDISSFLTHYEEQTDRTDGRGSALVEREIIPYPEFWEEAKKIYQEKGDEWCMSSAGTKYPSGNMKENLANKDLFGYPKKDKELPRGDREKIPLKKGKIRDLLGENHSKWKQ